MSSFHMGESLAKMWWLEESKGAINKGDPHVGWKPTKSNPTHCCSLFMP